eukprot:s2902_g4.t1
MGRDGTSWESSGISGAKYFPAYVLDDDEYQNSHESASSSSKQRQNVAPPTTPGGRVPPVAMGSPASSYGASEIGSQLMVTQSSLESWGNKVINWGKKHVKETYARVYETDQGYVKWVLARVDS